VSSFLILSEGGDGCGLAMRLQSEGHNVRVWIRETDAEHRCEGLIQKTNDLTFGEIVLADCTGFGLILDSFREAGRLVFGGSSLHDRLENDRKFAKQVMEDVGIETPDSEYLEGPEAWEQAREIIKESEVRLVFKPGGRLSGVLPSYVSRDNEDLLGMLDYFKDKVGSSEPEFELQEFKEGVAISTEGWFDGKDFIRPFNHTIERKQLMCGDLGPSGGCTGNVVWLVDDEDDPLVMALLRLKSFLAEHRYVGPIDLNAVVGDEGIYGLEFTPRFGYDAFPTFLLGLYSGGFGAFLSDVVRGNEAKLEVVDRFAAGVRVTIPPWPSEDFLASSGIPVRGLTSSDLKFFYPYDVMLRKDELESSGGWGIIGVVNGVGDSVEDAFADVYRSVRHLKVPDMQYRLDLGEVCSKDFRMVRSLLRELA
jgi:phosphoribosylamine---glycine ligase